MIFKVHNTCCKPLKIGTSFNDQETR
jgi:hypothetical protein